MLSTFVLLAPAAGAGSAVAGLVRTLSALVPCIIGAVVRDVTIVSGTLDGDVRKVADHAGCQLIEDASFESALRRAVSQARSPILFFLRAGASVDREFLDEVTRVYGPVPADGTPAMVLREAPDGLVRRVLPDLAPAAGLIAQASAVDTSAKDFHTLVRRTGGKRTLASRAAMAH